MDTSPEDLIGRRLAVQRLTTEPFEDPVDVVKLLLCVQAQDAPLARYSLGLRVAQSDDTMVRAALDDGRIVRTHILRPTWHYVAADDLRWILALTSAKVESSLSSRHRQLGVDEHIIENSHRELAAILNSRQFRTAAEIGEELAVLDDVLETVSCEGTTLWLDPSVIEPREPRRRVALLPTFDEAYLPYRSTSVPRIDGHPRGEEPHVFAEAGGGVVIVDRRDAGWWKRTARGHGPMTIQLGLATGLDTEQQQLIASEAAALAAFFGRDAKLDTANR